MNVQSLLQLLALEKNPRLSRLMESAPMAGPLHEGGGVNSRGAGGFGPSGTPLKGQAPPPPTQTRYVDDIGSRTNRSGEPLASGMDYQQRIGAEEAIQQAQWREQGARARAKRRSGHSLLPLLAATGLTGGGIGTLLAVLQHRARKLQEMHDENDAMQQRWKTYMAPDLAPDEDPLEP